MINCFSNLFSTRGLKNQRNASIASVAPIVEAKDAIIKPQPKPKIAPLAKVRIAAPGIDNAVMTM